MPHILLETTSDLPENAHLPDILEALVGALSAQPEIKPGSVKSYHALRSNWCVGDGHAPGVAHCTVLILSGRSLEWRNTLSDALFAVLQEQFKESLDAQEVGLSFELREMEAATYRKA